MIAHKYRAPQSQMYFTQNFAKARADDTAGAIVRGRSAITVAQFVLEQFGVATRDSDDAPRALAGLQFMVLRGYRA